MNNRGITYLSGADEFFGANYGAAEVYTLSRAGYREDCPNAAKLFSQIRFTVAMENELMAKLADGADANEAAREWLAAHPDAIAPWLDGVTTLDGQPGLAAVTAALGG